MPAGVEVVVDEGFATIDFVDRTLRGPGIAALLAVGGPETVETLTLEGPRRVYRVPEGNAREAGLLDDGGEFVTDVYHVAADGTETPLVPDADGAVTLVSDGTGGGDGLLSPIDNAEPPAAPQWPEGDPSDDWSLAELKAYAGNKGKDAHELRTKAKVLALINAPGDNHA